MSGDPGADSDRPTDGRSEIDELLEDLVYRHEKAVDDEAAVGVRADRDVEMPSARASPTDRRGEAPWQQLDTGGGSRRLAVVFAGSLLAAAVVVVVAVGVVLSSQRGADVEGAPVGPSTSVGGGAGSPGPTNTDDPSDARSVSGASKATSPTSARAEPASPLRLGLIVPGRASDRAFAQSMVDAATTLVGGDSGGEMAVSDGMSGSAARDEIRRFAREGYDLIIAHSSAFEAAVFEIAPSFPNVTFAVAGATDPVPHDNVYTYTAAAEEGGYVLGALGARLSSGGVIGVVGPVEVGVSKRYVDGFHQGAHDELDDVSVRITYTGSFSDAAAFAAATDRLLDQGADVITGHGHELDEAIETAAAQGAMWLGSQADQTPVSPASVVASQVYRWEVVLEPIAADIRTDRVDGRHLVANLANGGIVIVYNERRMPSAEILTRVELLTAEISTGSLRPLDGR